MAIHFPRRRLLAAALLCAAAAGSALAQTAAPYPSKPIQMVVPFAAGSVTDLLARIVAQRLGEALGQSIVVDNKPGADGNIGAAFAAAAPADGYTLMMGAASTNAINPSLHKNLRFNAIPLYFSRPLRRFDYFVGKLGVFRGYQGTVKKDTPLFVDDGRKPFKVGHLFKLRGKEHVEIEQAIPGDIAAVAKVDELHFDAVLHDSHDEDEIHLAPLEFPRPMFGLAVEAASKGHEQKLANALHKLAEEDPCFQVEHEVDTNETVIRGLSDLHLRIMLRRLKDKHGVEVNTHPPRIAYRETISGRAEGHHRHKKQTGGAGQFGEVFLRIEPLERGRGFEFVDAVKGGTRVTIS